MRGCRVRANAECRLQPVRSPHGRRSWRCPPHEPLGARATVPLARFESPRRPCDRTLASLCSTTRPSTEVIANGPSEIWVERRGRLQRASAALRRRRSAARRLRAAGSGPAPGVASTTPSRWSTPASPTARASMSSCRRSLGRPVVTIRNSGRGRSGLASSSSWGRSRARRGPVCAMRAGAALDRDQGGTSSGKTSLLGALSAASTGDRIVTVEDAAELGSTARTSCGSRPGGEPRREGARSAPETW